MKGRTAHARAYAISLTNFDELLWYLKLNSEVRGRCKLIFEKVWMFWKVLYLGLAMILEFYFQFKSRLAIWKKQMSKIF